MPEAVQPPAAHLGARHGRAKYPLQLFTPEPGPSSLGLWSLGRALRQRAGAHVPGIRADKPKAIISLK